jgi:hypothetical protein
MVDVATLLALAASVITLISALSAQNEKRVVIPVRKNTSGRSITAKDISGRDLARIAAYNSKSESISVRASGVMAINRDIAYVAMISFCSQTFALVVDTGSSNTWVCVLHLTTPNFLIDIHLYLHRQALAPPSHRPAAPVPVTASP